MARRRRRSAATRWARSRGCAPAATTGCSSSATGGPAARMLGLAALEPVLVVGDARVRLATDEWVGGDGRPARARAARRRSTSTDGVPRWRWQVGGRRARARARDGARPPRSRRSSTGSSRADRPVAARADAALHLARACTASGFANGDPPVEPTTDGFVFEGAYRVAGAGLAAGRRAGTAASAPARRRRAGWTTARISGPPGTLRAPSSSPASRHEVTAAAAPFDGAAGGRVDRRRRAAREPRALVDAPAPPTSRRAARARRRPVRDHHGGPADGRRRLPVVRRVVARPDDLLRGPLPRAPAARDEGREVLRTSAATVSEGMLANTADTGSLEYNTVDGTLWFVHALGRHVAVDRRRRPRRRARAGRSAQIVDAPPRRARGSGSASTPRTGCSGRAPKAGR